MSRLRIGIAGAGGMGGHHARMLSARDDAQVVSLFDTDPVAMNRLEKTLGSSVQGLNHFATLEAMIDSEQAGRDRHRDAPYPARGPGPDQP